MAPFHIERAITRPRCAAPRLRFAAEGDRALTIAPLLLCSCLPRAIDWVAIPSRPARRASSAHGAKFGLGGADSRDDHVAHVVERLGDGARGRADRRQVGL